MAEAALWVTKETRNNANQLKLKIAGEIGVNINTDDYVNLIVNFGREHIGELIERMQEA